MHMDVCIPLSLRSLDASCSQANSSMILPCQTSSNFQHSHHFLKFFLDNVIIKQLAVNLDLKIVLCSDEADKMTEDRAFIPQYF